MNENDRQWLADARARYATWKRGAIPLTEPEKYERFADARTELMYTDLPRALTLIAAQDAEIVRLAEELRVTRNVLADAIMAMGGSFEYRPRLDGREWTMSGLEPTYTGGIVYRAALATGGEDDPMPPGEEPPAVS